MKLLLKRKEFSLRGENSFFQVSLKGGKNENGRVASQENVPIQNKAVTFDVALMSTYENILGRNYNSNLEFLYIVKYKFLQFPECLLDLI